MTDSKNHWPDWSKPNDADEIELARILCPFIKIISPDIVKLLVEDNNKQLEKWRNSFTELNINPDIYLWENSPVAFPGIRRHVGNKEIKKFKGGSLKVKDSLALDDNSYPKEIWSYIFRNRKADKKGPTDYSLAHIIDHKDYKSRKEDEIDNLILKAKKNSFAALYTSVVNTIFVPNNFLKPTDHKGNLRMLLIQIIHEYYSPICTPLPYGCSYNLSKVEASWKLSNFPKPDIVGDVDSMDEFLKYRNGVVEDKINQFRSK